MNKVSVEEYILKSGQWQIPLNMLRELLLGIELKETVKWGVPVYCLNGKNIVGIASFKSYTGLWFYQGIFLKDKKKILINASKDQTRALRQLRFFSADEIEANLDTIIEYVKEAIENSMQGKELKPVRNRPFSIPVELTNEIENSPSLKKSFNLLSHSKKREFSHYIDQAKRPETRQKRLNYCIPLIIEGRGLMDQYRKGK